MDTENPIPSQERIAGLLAYILFIIPMIMQVKTEFTMFHAKQSFLLLIVSVIVFFVPLFGALVSTVIFFLSLWCMYQAYMGKKFIIPYLGENMDKLLTQLGLIHIFSIK